MAFITRGRQLNIRKSDTYDDSVAPSVTNFVTNVTSTEGDFNSLRSMVSHLKDGQAGDWTDVLVTPSTFENGAQRGVDDIATDLHELERKRFLDTVLQLGGSISGGSSVQGVVLTLAQLPANTTIAIGSVTTLGTVVASASAFLTFSSTDIVSGLNALRPSNLVPIFDSTTGDEILSTAGHTIAGLLQSESVIDGSTATGTTTNRLQVSFVEANASFDGIQLIPAGDMDGRSFDFASTERFALDDLPETAFLGPRFADAGATTADRQLTFDNQGSTPVDATSSAIVDLEAAGISVQYRDDLEAALWTLTEGSAGGTTSLTIEAGVDVYQNSAIDVDFTAGITVREGGTRPIDIGLVDGSLATSAGDLEVRGFAELLLDDGNQAGSTWAQTAGIKLSETTAEWDAFEVEFGEVSVLNAMVQAKNSSNLEPTYAVLTADVTAGTDIGGVAGGANLNAQLPDLSDGTLFSDYDFQINGKTMRPGVSADWEGGTSLVNGQIKLKGDIFTGDVVNIVKRV